jgi:hypothetical protein
MTRIALALVLTLTVAGTASANFLDDFENPPWNSGDNVMLNNGWSDDGGLGLVVNANDGISVAGSPTQGVVQTHGSVFGRTVHAGNLGGSFTAHVSAFLRVVNGQAALKLTDNVNNQQGYEANVTFFGLGQGGNSNRVETSLGLNNVGQGGEATTPGAIDFDSLDWIQAELGYEGGTTLSARWRDVDNNGVPQTAWSSIGFGAGTVPANSVFEFGGIYVAPGGGRADNVRIATTPFPEPASLGLLAIGGMAMMLRRRQA